MGEGWFETQNKSNIVFVMNLLEVVGRGLCDFSHDSYGSIMGMSRSCTSAKIAHITSERMFCFFQRLDR